MEVEYHPYQQPLYIYSLEKYGNRPQVLVRIKVEQLLISHTRMVIKLLMRRAEKSRNSKFFLKNP